MSDNTAVVLSLTLLACVCGGLIKCAADNNRSTDLTLQARNRELADSRNRCIAGGHAWVSDNCIPKCVP